MSIDLPAWRLLSDRETRRAWDRFDRHFAFRPCVTADAWPSIREPTPSVTWDISAAWSDPDPFLRSTNAVVNAAFLSAFQSWLSPSDSILALDWQHPCYQFFPHRRQGAWPPEEWPIPVIPAGDYYVFVANDLLDGLFGHPWESSVCVFGTGLLNHVQAALPSVFGRVLRRDGQPPPWPVETADVS